MSAVVKSLPTRATRTDSAPAVKAPTMGMKPAKKVMIASGPASGTPRMNRPSPMKKASMKLTMAWVRMKPPSVFQQRVRASVMC